MYKRACRAPDSGVCGVSSCRVAHHAFGTMLARRAVGHDGSHDARAALGEAADNARQEKYGKAVRHAPNHLRHGQTHLRACATKIHFIYYCTKNILVLK